MNVKVTIFISLLVICTHCAHLENSQLSTETNLFFNISQLSISSVANLAKAEGLGKGIVLASNRQNLFIVTKDEDNDLSSSLVESIASKKAPLLTPSGGMEVDLNEDGWIDIAYVSQGGGEIMWLERTPNTDDTLLSTYIFNAAVALSVEV